MRDKLEETVRKTIQRFGLLAGGEHVLVAVSGGKDSLALWDLLRALDYEADGLYVGLGIGEYSESSGTYARDFASERTAAGRRVPADIALALHDAT